MKTILFIGHDANRAGAQLVLLDLLRRLHGTQRYRLRLLLGAGGPLLADYQAVATVTMCPAPTQRIVGALADRVLFRLGLWPLLSQRQQTRQQQQLADALQLGTVDLVLVNTVSSAKLFRQIELPTAVPVITFVHELAMAVDLYSQPDELRHLLNRTSQLLAVSQATADYYVTRHGMNPAIVQLFTLIDIPELDRRIADARADADPFPALGLRHGTVVIGGCGNAEWRKGCDLFVTLARLTINRLAIHPATDNSSALPPVCFVWVGMPPGAYADQLRADVDKAGLSEQIRLLPPTPDVLRYSTRFAAFALTSREDPYPLVVFEAGLSQVPVVCFAGAGGAPELVDADGGSVVPYLSLDAMSHQLARWLTNPAEPRSLGATLDQKIRQRHNPADAMATLDDIFARLLPAR